MREQPLPTETEFAELALRHLDGLTEAHEVEQLNAWLQQDERYRQQFVWLSYEARLLSHRGQTTELTMPAGRLQRGWQALYDVANNYITLSLLISAITMAIVVLSLGLFKTQQPEPFVPADTIRFLARITDSQDVLWTYRDNQPVERAHLSPGRELALRSGLIEVTFDDGAVVLLEGPAEFQIDNAGAGTLTNGTLVARVPSEGIGFTVHTPYGDVIDLGTEFSVSIDASENAATVQVFQGAIKYRSSGVPDQRLVAGNGLRKVGDRIELFKADGRTFAAMRENFASSNLLVNGGFDEYRLADEFAAVADLENQVDGWKHVGTDPLHIQPKAIGVQPRSHPHFARFMGHPQGGAGVVQAFRTTPGVRYTVTVAITRFQEVSTPTLAVDLFDGDAGTDTAVTGDLAHRAVAIDWLTGEWREIRVEFTAKSNQSTLRLLEPFSSSSAAVAPCIDSVAVFEIDNLPKVPHN